MKAALRRLTGDKPIDSTHLEVLKTIDGDLYEFAKGALTERF